MWLTVFIFFSTVFGTNSQGYEAYSGGTHSAAVDSYGESVAKVPALPIEPPRINAADADLLSQSVGSATHGTADIQSPQQHSGESSKIEDNSVDGASAAIHSSDNDNNVSGPSLGYRPPPPPTRRETESYGKCTFDESKWTHEPESAIAQAIMFDRTTGIECEECLKKCSDQYQDHSVPWVCRSLTYDHQWKICDLFAVNGTESPYHLTEFHSRDYFEYLAALPPTDEQLTAVTKSEEAAKEKSENASADVTKAPSNVTPRPSCSKSSSSSSSEEKSSKDKSSQTIALVQIKITEPAETTPASIETTLDPREEQQEVIASKVDKENTEGMQSNPATKAPAVIQHVDSASGSASNSITGPTSESSKSSSSIANDTELVSGTASSLADSSAKSYASKIQQLTEIKITPIKPHAEIIVERSFETEISPSRSTAQLSDFQSALENLKSENVRQESEISDSTTNDLNELKKPKIIKLGKKTTTTTLIRTKGIAPAPSTEFKNLKSSIHALGDGAVVGTETNETTSFVQEHIVSSSSSSSSASASVSASASTKEIESYSSSSNSSAHSQQPLSIVSHSTNMESIKSHGQKIAADIQSDAEKMSSCDEDSLSRFLSFDGFERADNATAKPFPLARSVEECVDACDSQRLKACSSLIYSEARGCELYTTAVDHHTAGVLKATLGLLYVEKFCIPTKKAQTVRKISPVVPNHILVGHVQEVTDAKSFVDCQISCLNSDMEYGFTCKSAMWYPLDSDQNCLLNAENRHTQPEVFVTEDPGVVMHYFELVPEKTTSALKIKAIQQMMRFRDLPLQVERRLLDKSIKKFDANIIWTHWSACKVDEENTMLAIRIRYMKCSEHKDIRKCPKETSTCANSEPKTSDSSAVKAAEKSICLAVRDAIGRKHCPYGMRMKENGQREFCTNPVDCS